MPRRPPSSAAIVILHSMQRIWGGIFVPATCCAALGTTLIGVALVAPSGAGWLAVFAMPIVVSVAVVGLSRLGRLNLGHSD
jgi:hypothetical protein